MAEMAEMVEKLNGLLDEIRGFGDPRRASSQWKQAFKLLGEAGLPTREYQSVVGMRDVDALATLIERMASPEVEVSDEDVPSAEVCRKALQTFRKRVKFTRLDDESKLGRGPLSKGGDDRLGAITPPTEWPDSVWRELVRQGKLKYLGDGMYELPKS